MWKMKGWVGEIAHSDEQMKAKKKKKFKEEFLELTNY